MKRFSKILVPVDFRPACEAGCRYAVRMAQTWGATLCFLHVIPRYPLAAGLLAPIQGMILNTGEPREGEETETLEKLAAFLEPIPLGGIPNERLVVKGVPSLRILEAVESHGAGLLVQGVHTRSVLEDRILGSTAEWIIRRSRCPVLSLKPEPGGPPPRFPPARILCATDFSQEARAALDFAVILARASDAEILLVHAAGETGGDKAPAVGEPSKEGPGTVEDRMGALRRQIEALYDPERVQWRVAAGGAAAAILSLAEEEAVDVVVMGAQGQGGLWPILVGGTAGRVIRSCRVPVLTLRPSRKLEKVEERFRRVYRKIGSSELQRMSPEETAFGKEDLNGLEGMKESRLLLNFYSREGVLAAMGAYGVLDSLRRKGFEDFQVEFDLRDTFRHRLRLYAYSRKNGRNNLLVEAVLREETLLPIQPDETGTTGFPGPFQALSIEWLCMQDPTAAFTPERPPLPGQDHPGLGLGYETHEFLTVMAMRLKKDAILNHPQYYHNACLYHRSFRFQDPVQEGRLVAILRDTWDADLADVSWAVQAGCLREVASGRKLTWQGGRQISPLAGELKAHFASPAYQDEVWRSAAAHRFRIDWALYRKRIARSRPLSIGSGAG